MGTRIEAGHEVDPKQFEPGLPLSGQADRHAQQFVLLSTDLRVAYVLKSWLEVSVALPLRTAIVDAQFLDDSGEPLPGFTSIHHRTETLYGLGDLGFNGRFRLLSRSKKSPFRVDLTTGFTVPTGNIEPNPFALGRMGIRHQHIFFGRGTVDPRLGLQVEWNTPKLTVLFETNWSGSLYENEYEYQGPQVLSFGLNLASDLGFEQWQFRLGAELFKEFPARWAGETAENSGRLDVVPALGVGWRPSQLSMVTLMLKRPIVISTEGGQLEIPLMALFGVTVSFDTLKPKTPIP